MCRVKGLCRILSLQRGRSPRCRWQELLRIQIRHVARTYCIKDIAGGLSQSDKIGCANPRGTDHRLWDKRNAIGNISLKSVRSRNCITSICHTTGYEITCCIRIDCRGYFTYNITSCHIRRTLSKSDEI